MECEDKLFWNIQKHCKKVCNILPKKARKISSVFLIFFEWISKPVRIIRVLFTAEKAIRRIGIYTSFSGLRECHSYTDSITVTLISFIRMETILQ